MDFFSAQDDARKVSAWLVLLFLAGVALLIAGLYCVFEFARYFTETYKDGTSVVIDFDPKRFGAVAFAVGGLILVASVTKILTLKSGGGQAIASSLGGKMVPRSTSISSHRRLINVVDEMAIASGISPPKVYVMPDTGSINAFAAGYSESDAVIGVTQGALDSLSRDELQGVIAHEFSHIIHGDMRLNMRLIGIVFGIAALGYIGYASMRSSIYIRRDPREMAMTIAIGLTLTILGFFGVLAGNMIRAAISRQREYLADASAVQYTRNPGGIGNALIKLARTGGKVAAPGAAECSHMLFEEGVKAGLSNPMATHPPIRKRIKRVLPNWDGGAAATGAQEQAPAADPSLASGFAGEAQQPESNLGGGENVDIEATDAVSAVGNNTTQSHAFAKEMLVSLPPVVMSSIEDPFSARAVIYALLLDEGDEECRQRQIAHLRDKADSNVFQAFEKIVAELIALPRRWRLPVVELCMTTLRDLSDSQRELFESNMTALIEADDKIDVFEWCLHTLLVHRLSAAGKQSLPSMRMSRSKAAEYALSAMAKFSDTYPETAFDNAVAGLKNGYSYIEDDPDRDTLRSAFLTLRRLNQRRKRELISIATNCIAPQGTASMNAIEMLRVLSSILDCPMPPLTGPRGKTHN